MGKWVGYSPAAEGEEWQDWIKIGCYFLLLCYLFIGIAIASDIFMSGIEKICGATKTKKVVKEEDGVVVITTKTTPVWNETVANLSLMALGSSAPEILLSAIEITEGLRYHNPGDLGPGTIVGSAAFNLMIISAVCILSLANKATSRIKLYKVFAVTSITSLLAYVWMLVVLDWISKDEVEMLEAILTLVFFPALVLLAYWADQDFCCGRKKRRGSTDSDDPSAHTIFDGRDFYFGDHDHDNLYDADGNYDRNALVNLYNKLNAIADLRPEEIVSILATKLIQGKHHHRTWYRTQKAKTLMGGTTTPVLDEKLQEVVDVLDSSKSTRVRQSVIKRVTSAPSSSFDKAFVEFQAATLAVKEAVGEVQIQINRTGRLEVSCKVQVDTTDGTARKGKEYEPVKGLIVAFEPYVMEQVISVKIIDNVQWNPDNSFFVKLSLPDDPTNDRVVLGKMRVVEIIIEDDDIPGKLAFEKRGYVFKHTLKKVQCDVVRTDGSDGIVSVNWKVVVGPNCTVIAPDSSGELTFAHGEKKKYIQIPLLKKKGTVQGSEETFEVILFDPTGGASIGKINRTTCAVSSDESFKLEINNIVTQAVRLSEDAEEDPTYGQQIYNSLVVNGGETKKASCKDWIFHLITLPLKFLCSLIPPAAVCGGWLCFVMALLFIGLLTKLVGDTASSFGVALGIDPTITAITFVALGTSLPDTFASRIAAINDKTADNAIGNVTGSNSVNVFLGLGVPWTIGAIYYHFFWDDYSKVSRITYNGISVNLTDKNGKIKAITTQFCVPAGTLSFNVVVFSICAFISLLILTWRRYAKMCGQAELGGPGCSKWSSAILMILLWGAYIGASSYQATLERRSTPSLEKLMAWHKDHRNVTACALVVRAKREFEDKGMGSSGIGFG